MSQTSGHEPHESADQPGRDEFATDAPAGDGTAVGPDSGSTAGQPGQATGQSSDADAAADGDEFDRIVEDTLSDVGAERHGIDHAAHAAELKGDLQRLQAEYVNYKRRVDRDREVIKTNAVSNVVESLIPVLDDIYLARQHGDLTDGPFAAIADKLEATLAKQGVVRFGEVGETFDPHVHEALMHGVWDPSNEALPKDATDTTIVTVLQPGYRTGERIVRPARVAVADPS